MIREGRTLNGDAIFSSSSASGLVLISACSWSVPRSLGLSPVSTAALSATSLVHFLPCLYGAQSSIQKALTNPPPPLHFPPCSLTLLDTCYTDALSPSFWSFALFYPPFSSPYTTCLWPQAQHILSELQPEKWSCSLPTCSTLFHILGCCLSLQLVFSSTKLSLTPNT